MRFNFVWKKKEYSDNSMAVSPVVSTEQEFLILRELIFFVV